MRSRYIFDAGVLFLYFAGNSKVRGYFEEANRGESEGFVSEVTLAEFYYKTAEEFGLEVAKIRYDSIRNSRIKEIGGDRVRCFEVSLN